VSFRILRIGSVQAPQSQEDEIAALTLAMTLLDISTGVRQSGLENPDFEELLFHQTR